MCAQSKEVAMKKKQVVYTLIRLIAMWVLVRLNSQLLESGSRLCFATTILLYGAILVPLMWENKEWRTYAPVKKVCFLLESVFFFGAMILTIFLFISAFIAER